MKKMIIIVGLMVMMVSATGCAADKLFTEKTYSYTIDDEGNKHLDKITVKDSDGNVTEVIEFK